MPSRSLFPIRPLAAALAIGLLPLASHAAFSGITDPSGDFLSTFGGSASSTDLDVLSATVLYDISTDLFSLTATMAGPIGLTANSLYVWGVNRGAGTAGFAANGITGVRFDRTVQLRADGTGAIGGVGALPAGSITISGNTITALVSGALLPSTGFANKLDYTWNLWPRNQAFTGFAAISDFAPDNANFTTTAVPEPGIVGMLLAGMAAVGWRVRRKG